MHRIQRVRVIILSITITLLLALVYNRKLSHSSEFATSFETEPFVHAAQQFAALKQQGNEQIPETTTARQLASAGLLDEEYISALGETRLTISLLHLVNLKPILPQDTLIRVNLPDGDSVVVLGDGSIRQNPH